MSNYHHITISTLHEIALWSWLSHPINSILIFPSPYTSILDCLSNRDYFIFYHLIKPSISHLEYLLISIHHIYHHLIKILIDENYYSIDFCQNPTNKTFSFIVRVL
jgi:hypothetical protein